MRYPNEFAASGAGPVRAPDRLVGLDVVRGVAVTGILVMNIYAFAMPFPAYGNPLVMGGTGPLNLGTWFFTHVLFDQKFMSIFSMLFGAGLIMMMDRAGARAAAFGPIYLRRTFWLAILGLVHGYLIWFGDILFHYALAGMLVFLFRKKSAPTLIRIACLLLPVALLINYGSSFYLEELQSQGVELAERKAAGDELDDEQQRKLDEWLEVRAFFAPTEDEIAADVEAYRGSYREILKHRAPITAFMQVNLTPVIVIWRVGGLMLLGMAFMKLGILSGERSRRFYSGMAALGYGIGLPLAMYSAWLLNAHEFDPLFISRFGGIPNYVGSILVAFGHIGAVLLIVNSGALAGLTGRFAAVGRMALSNYLMHSIVMTTIFYGYGLGLYAEVSRFWQQAFVIGLIGVQLLISPWWLSRFQFGPLEWLWRSLTYGQRQPMRR